MTARKNFLKFSLNKTTEKFFIEQGTPGRKRNIIYTIRGLSEINSLLYLNFEIKFFALEAKKKFIKELIKSVNKETHTPKYPKVRVEIKSTGVTIPTKDTQNIETITKEKENL